MPSGHELKTSGQRMCGWMLELLPMATWLERLSVRLTRCRIAINVRRSARAGVAGGHRKLATIALSTQRHI